MINQIFDLHDKNIIITGASSGIGLQLCRTLSHLSANVYGISKSKIKNENFDSFACDLTCEASTSEVINSIGTKVSKIDCLINVAGISITVENGNDFEAFNRTIDLNLISSFKCSKIASGYMATGSSIINFSSIGGLQGFPNNPGYTSSKGAIISLTQSLAVDLGHIGVRVNSISPGYIFTKMTESSYNDADSRKERLDRMIIKRWGKPKDLIGIVIYLSCDASSYVTGQNFVIDGGWTAKGL